MAIDIHVEEQFKGPMDLLLYLIKRDEIDIYDIPISHITREYMKALNEMPIIDVDLGGEFAGMASMLMELKAKLMLPPEEVDEDEEVVELDPRAGLVEALLEYKKFKEAAGNLDALMELHASRFPRIVTTLERIQEATPEEEMIDANAYELYGRMAQLMRETLAQTAATTIVATEISTEACIDSIQAKIRIKGRVGFTELLSQAPSREEMVVFFIAILELIRLRKVVPFQAEDFSEIYLEERKPDDHVTPIESATGYGLLSLSATPFSRAAGILHLPIFAPPPRVPFTRSRPAASGFLPGLPLRGRVMKPTVLRPFLPFAGRSPALRSPALRTPAFPEHLVLLQRLSAKLLTSATENTFCPGPFRSEMTDQEASVAPVEGSTPVISLDQVVALLSRVVLLAGGSPEAIFASDRLTRSRLMLYSFLAGHHCLAKETWRGRPESGGNTRSVCV